MNYAHLLVNSSEEFNNFISEFKNIMLEDSGMTPKHD